MSRFITLKTFLIAIPVLIIAIGLSYALPQVDVVRAVGVEVKRVDITDSETGQQRTRDVYQLQMETPEGRPRVYRNEDNFLYGKFDSANLQAQIQSLAAEKQLVALRHYGWRLTLFSTFPNAVKAWPVEEGYRHIPIFNTVVLLGLAILGFMGFRRVRRAATARAETRRAREAERSQRDALAARTAQRTREAEQKNQADLNDFLNSGDDKKD
ncbi:DUF1523 family protein [Oceaniglobus ichthyenteri]|uniref:DUF1523 family protein n=1 Tax=Oceaniglobus ichthyenteri TaxID=2136177 RepID=UPI0013DDB78C|nr:DUF1523 family protein [Oceaniglobus ichthyenteri]